VSLRLQPGRIQRTATILLAALVLTTGCGGAEQSTPDVSAAPEALEESAPEATRVQVERVRSTRLTALVAASGTIEARRLTEVAGEVPGRIIEVMVAVGDEVAAGAPLFRIDPQPYRTALAEAQAGLALARAESANASQEAHRMELLVKQKVASQQRYDQLRTQAEVSEARVAQVRAQVTRAQRDLDRTQARAPYAGSVVERRSHEGAMASVGTPVVVLQESGALEAILDVPEATPIPIRSGDPVTLFIEGLPDALETRVSRVSHRVDPQTRTYEVRAELSDPGDDLKAGSYARAEISPTRATARPVVDRSALLTRDGRTYALRVEDGVVRRVQVRRGIAQGDRVEVLQGLEDGDLAVRGEAVTRLADGARLRIVDPQPEVSTAHLETTP